MYAILIAAAVIPAVILLVKVYQADRLEKEPLGLLLSLVFLGIISTSLAALTEQLGDAFLSQYFEEDSILYKAIMYFIVVALSEEGFKYLLLKFRTWNNPNFNFRFDGVVYAVFVSLGFALWENIGYVMMYGLGAAATRAVTAVPGHACFGVFMGVWYGIAKQYDLAGRKENAKQFRKGAVWVPVVLHGLYDFIASLDQEYMTLVFLVFIGILFFISLRLVKRTSAQDTPLIPQDDYIDFPGE